MNSNNQNQFIHFKKHMNPQLDSYIQQLVYIINNYSFHHLLIYRTNEYKTLKIQKRFILNIANKIFSVLT